MSYAELCLYGTYTFPHQISCLSRDFAITLIIGEKNKRKVYNSAFNWGDLHVIVVLLIYELLTVV